MENAKQENTKTTGSLNNLDSQKTFKHVLSPLELEALRYSYKPFEYDFDGITLMISQRDCSHILTTTVMKLKYFTEVINRTTSVILGGSEHLRSFMESSLDDHNIPPYLINRLRSIDCENIYDLVSLGRWKVSMTRGVGKSAMKTLDRLFLRHDSTHLFS